MTMNVSSSDIGNATAGMIVSRTRPRNRNTTKTTSTKAMSNVVVTSLTEFSILIARL